MSHLLSIRNAITKDIIDAKNIYNAQVEGIKSLMAARAGRDSLINKLFFEDKTEGLYYITTVPLRFFLRNGILSFLGGVGLMLTGGVMPLTAGLIIALLSTPTLVPNIRYWAQMLYHATRLSRVDLLELPLIDKLSIMDPKDYEELTRNLGFDRGEAGDLIPMKSIVSNIKAGNGMFSDSQTEMLDSSDIVRDAQAQGITIEPTTVEEIYVTQGRPTTDQEVDRGFQAFNFENTDLEPSIETINIEFARQGTLILNNLIRMAEENPEALMSAINRYIEQRKMIEAPRGTADNFQYVTMKDIKNLTSISADVRERGFLRVTSRDVAIIGRLFGLNAKDSLNTLSGFWSEARWPVTLGIPMFPGTTKGRVRIGERGATLADARDIPLISAFMTLAEPPWLAAMSGFNVLQTNANEPAEALAEDTLFGIRGIYNPENQPDTPAISFHLKDYIEKQNERRISAEESLQRSAAFGKGISMMYGMQVMFEHPFFRYGINEDEKASWSSMVQNLFNAKAYRRDEISYEGVGRGTGWINYILFGYTLYGHLGRRVGPFPPGLANAYQTIKMLQELDGTMNGRLFKIIRWMQLNRETPIANGLMMVDYRIAASIAKAFDKVPNGDQIVDEMLENSVRDYIASFDESDYLIAIQSLQAGDELFGHHVIPSDIEIPELASKSPYSYARQATDNYMPTPEMLEIEQRLKELYTPEEIDRLKSSFEHLSYNDTVEVLRRILAATEKPLPKISFRDTLKELWNNRFARKTPNTILRTRGINTFLGKLFKAAIPIVAISTWGWWAGLIPMFLLVTEASGWLKRSLLTKTMRYVAGGAAVYLYIMLNGLTFGLPALFVLAGMLIGGDRLATSVLFLADLSPVLLAKTISRIYSLSSTFTHAMFLRNSVDNSGQFNKNLIIDMMPLIGSRIANVDDFDRLFNKRLVMMNLREVFFDQLKQYYSESQINTIKENISKFDIVQQFQILNRVMSKARMPRPSVWQGLVYAFKAKPGDKKSYRESLISFFKDNMSKRSYKTIMTGAAVLTIVATHLSLIGIPATFLGGLALFLEAGAAINFGTNDFRHAMASLMGVLFPIVYIGLFGISSSFFPIVVLALLGIFGYITGATLGIMIPNIPEFIANLLNGMQRFFGAPFKLLSMNLTHTSDQRRQILFTSLPHLLQESNTSTEFIRKFEALFIETLDKTGPFDVIKRDSDLDGGIGGDTPFRPQGPSGDTPSTDGTTPPNGSSAFTSVQTVAAPAESGARPAQNQNTEEQQLPLQHVADDVDAALKQSPRDAMNLYREKYMKTVEATIAEYLTPRRFTPFAENYDTEVGAESIIDHLASIGLISVQRDEEGNFVGFNGAIAASFEFTESKKLIALYLNNDGIKVPLSLFEFDPQTRAYSGVVSFETMFDKDYSFTVDLGIDAVRETMLPHMILPNYWNTYDALATLKGQAEDATQPEVAQKAREELGDMRKYFVDYALNTGRPFMMGDYIYQYGEVFTDLFQHFKKAQLVESVEELPFDVIQEHAGNQFHSIAILEKLDDNHYLVENGDKVRFVLRVLSAKELNFIENDLQGSWKDNPVLGSMFQMIDNSGLALLRDGVTISKANEVIQTLFDPEIVTEADTPETQNVDQSDLSAVNVLPLYKSNKKGYFDEFNHTHRMLQLVEIIANELDVTEQEMEMLKQLALVHSLGKVGIDNEVFTNARNYVVSKTKNPFVSRNEVMTILTGGRMAESSAVATSRTIPGPQKEAQIKEIQDRYDSYIQAYLTLFSHGKAAVTILKEKFGVELAEDSPMYQILVQHNLPELTISDDRTRYLASILIAANIIDATQAKEKNTYYNRIFHSLSDDKYGLLPNIERAIQDGRLDESIYPALSKLLFLQENESLLRLIIAARNGQFDSLSVTADDLNKLRDEIAAYFRNLNKETQVTTEPADTEQLKETENPTVTPVVDSQTETPVVQPAEILAPQVKQPVIFTQEEVDKIFREFSPFNPKPMHDYLDAYGKTPQVLPSLIAIYSNEDFRGVLEVETSPKQIHEKLMNVAEKVSFSRIQVAQLQSIFEKTEYVKPFNYTEDVLVFDFDSLGFSTVGNSASMVANEELRKMFLYYFVELRNRYKANNRTPHLVLISENQKIDQRKMRDILGTALWSQFEVVYPQRIMSMLFSNDPSVRYSEMIISLATEFDVNSVNMKVFSYKSQIMDSAIERGAILADRDGTALDAIKIFATVHPRKMANHPLRNSSEHIKDIMNGGGLKYQLLGGVELSVKKPVPQKMRTIGKQQFIDSAA